MKIEKIEAIPFTIPLKSPTGFSHATIADAEHVLIRVRTDDGLVGQAEAPARPFTYGESQESIVAAVRKWFVPALTGLDPFQREVVRARMDWLAHNHTAHGAIDMALWDLIGQACGQSVHRLLGGYTDTVPVTHILFEGTPERMVDEAVAMRERHGFGTFKIKTGVDPQADIAAMRKLRAALGDDVELYIDSNKGWTSQQAVFLLPVMQEVGITMLEEPTKGLEPLARRRLARHTSIPILGDESVSRLGEVAMHVLDDHSQMISIKTARTGFTESQKIVGLCEGLGVGLVMGSQMDGMVGALGTLTFGAAFRSTARRAGEYGYFMNLTDDLLTDPLEVVDGCLPVRDRPGVGIEIDEDKLRHYRVDLG
ncbi:mandelate racemase/muconate lactonizing enzyme family protein [Amycolatopsis thermoflava]|uniref:mandelate racemase/muconate lactonizing enzyme family protein n=1 Tax=Amycolatopsis TaxID=1813 RepID=UPI0033B317D9